MLPVTNVNWDVDVDVDAVSVPVPAPVLVPVPGPVPFPLEELEGRGDIVRFWPWGDVGWECQGALGGPLVYYE